MRNQKKWPAPVALDGEGAQAVEVDGERTGVHPSETDDNCSTKDVQTRPGGNAQAIGKGFTLMQIESGKRTLRLAVEWRRANAQAWAAIVRHALDLASKEQPIATQALIESVRKKAFVDAHGKDTRTNNSFGPIFARWLIVEHPSTAPYIERRRSVFDLLVKGGFRG